MIKDLRKIAKNFSSLFFAQALYKTLALFTYILVARYLGVINFGRLSFALSFVGLFTVILDFGLSEFLIRDVAGRINELSQKYVSNILTVKFILSIFGYSLIALIGSLFSRTPEIKAVVLVLAAALVLDSFTLFFRCVFRLFERMEFEALSLTVEGVLKLGIVFIALKIVGIEILIVAYALILVSVFTIIFTAFLSWRRFIKLRLSFDYGFCKELFEKSLPFALLAFFGVLNFKITTVIISRMVNDLSTGWYSAAVRLVEPILIIPVTATIVLFSAGSRLYKTSQNSLASLYKISLRYLFWISIFIVVALNIYARRIVSFVFSEKYINAIIPLRILSLSLIPFFIKFYLERVILIINKPRVILLSYGFGTLIVVIFGIGLVKAIGYSGAGIALVLSEFFIAGYNFIWMKKYLINIPLDCKKVLDGKCHNKLSG